MNVELRQILNEWSACTLSPEEAETRLKALFAEDSKKESRGISLMQLAMQNLGNVPTGLLSPSGALGVNGINAGKAIASARTLQDFLCDYDNSFATIGELHFVHPQIYEAQFIGFRPSGRSQRPIIQIQFNPR